MKTVLVTGGGGFIGSHVCKLLAQHDYFPVSYDNLVYGHKWAAKWGPLEVGDVTDRKRLDEIFDRYQPEAVMHFAAYAYVNESVANPGKYYRNNVVGSLTLVEAMRDHGVGQIIFSSSCSTYGVPMFNPISEDHPQNPITPYGASKLMVERIFNDFDQAHGIRSISLRYFNAAGADPEGEIGENHDPETHLIPLVLDVASGKRSHVVIYGDEYDTPDGTCIRDYIHVTDLARAHLLALGALSEGRQSVAYNLGNGSGYSVKQVIDTAANVTSVHIPVKIGPPRPGDPACLVGDSHKAMLELGWKPYYADLSVIIESAWKWQCAFHNNSLKTAS